MGLVAVVVACALVVVLTPVVEKASLMKNKYWITNQRIIHMTKGGMFYYMDLADVDQYEIVTDLSDQETLVLGSAIFADAKKYIRWRANHPMEDPEAMKNRDHVDGMIFYNIGSSPPPLPPFSRIWAADGLPDQFRIPGEAVFCRTFNCIIQEEPQAFCLGLFFCVQKYFFSLLT